MTAPPLDLLTRLGLALAIGFLVGVERGWRHRDAIEGSRAAGLRTHALIGLFGGLAAGLQQLAGGWAFAALTLSFAAAFILFKLREFEADGDVSVTGTIAGLTVFALGAYAVLGEPQVAAAAGVALTALLAFKSALHAWLDRLTWPEIRSALLLLAATAIALPLLPELALDPWGAINARELWLLTILVAGASFAGYVAVRLLGPGVGLLVGAAAGALVSSTIVTADLGRRARAGEVSFVAAAAAANLATAVSLLRVGALVSVLAPMVQANLWAPLLAAGAAFLILPLGRQWRTPAAGGAKELRNPFELGSVAKLAAMLGAITIIGRLVTDAFGELGLLPFAAAAGFADADPVAIAASRLALGGLDPRIAAHAVLIAVLANTLAKAALAFYLGGWRFGGFYSAGAALAALAGLLAFTAL